MNVKKLVVTLIAVAGLSLAFVACGSESCDAETTPSRCDGESGMQVCYEGAWSETAPCDEGTACMSMGGIDMCM